MYNKNRVVDRGASRNFEECQQWMGPRQSQLAGHCYYVGNTGQHGRHMSVMGDESDSNESSNHPSLPDLIPRVADSDSNSDKESNWTSTTEELTDNDSVISHKSDAPNKNTIQIGNVRVTRSR